MAEKGYSYVYRGNAASGGGGDGRNRRTLVIFIIVSAVFICGLFVLYKYANRGEREKVKPGTPGETQPDKPKTGPKKPESQPRRVSSQKLTGEALAKVQKECENAQAMLQAEEYAKAADLANKIIPKVAEDSKLWQQAVKILNQANTTIFTTDIPIPDRKILYNVKSGAALVKIAKKFKPTVEAFQKANNMDPTNHNIRVGQTLSIYKGDWNIAINKRKFRLYLFEGKNRLFKVYTVGIGRQNRTPVGIFKIKNKIIEPDWDSPKGRIPFGAEGHELGTRWMGFSPTGDTAKNLTGYGIHGTWKPETIGKASSNGCIRMHNEEVNELFSIIPHQTPVTVRDQ